ncbi:hypothetical protein GCM10007386_40670 [Pseudoduganella dura]|nr:FxDxF family PEP-CTERM protein [Pseudoduganella dura]GGY05871.1 hypothetical protein GCM10007386_40670 [Pseudoduganella dura]
MNVTKFFRAAIATSALFVGLASTASAEIVTWTGDTTGGATVDLTPFEIDGDAVPYFATTFTVDADGPYSFLLTGTYGTDTVTLLYENSFDSSDATVNFLNGSDDDVTINTSSFAEELTAGTTYVFVVTGYNNTDFGKYSVTIEGPGLASVSAVPEPSTYAMLGLGLAAVGFTARRRKALK